MFFQACRDIFQSQKTATKEQRQFVEHACNDNNTNMKVLSCVREIMDVTPVENSKQCMQFTSMLSTLYIQKFFFIIFFEFTF